MKPSGQKESRRTSLLRYARVGVACMMVCVISNTAWTVKDGGLRDVELQTSICLENGLELDQNL
jgi:hypothetical protein